VAYIRIQVANRRDQIISKRFVDFGPGVPQQCRVMSTSRSLWGRRRLMRARLADGGNELTAELQHHKELQHENSLAAAMQSQHFTVLS
jgi:hypothetical protein